MNTKILIASLTAIFFSQTLFAEGKLNFTFSPIINRSFGYTNYVMDAYASGSDGIVVRLKSELKFPLDAFMTGARICAYKEKMDEKDWFIELGLLKNLNNPAGLMKDHDWIAPAGFALFKWSYTESNAELKSILVNIQASKRIFSWSKSSTYITAGYRYQKIEQDIIGYDGWQYDITSPNPERYNISGTERALYYKVTYKTPFAGVLYNIETSQRISFDITAAYILAFVSDYDDHFLRYKVAVADGTGRGFFAALNFHYMLGNKNQALRPFFSFEGQFITMKVSTEQTQTWYGDDPIQEGDETGTSISNVPHDISTLQLTLGLRIGLTF